jgi:glyoxylase-like metal-dependent hydrolase (beta-lactamase superfamily II)
VALEHSQQPERAESVGEQPAAAAAPAAAQRVAPGIWRAEYALTPEIPLFLHVVADGGEAVQVDSGIADAFATVRGLWAAAGVEPATIRLLVNTHAHHDHVGANGQVVDATGALVAAPEGAIAWIEDHERQLGEFAFSHPAIHPETAAERAELAATLDRPTHVALTLREGTLIRVGALELETLELPGHMPAEVGFYERTHGTLLLGDAITNLDTRIFHGHVSPRAYRATLARLRGLVAQRPVATVLTAHHGALDAGGLLRLAARADRHLDAIDATLLQLARDEGPVGLERAWRATLDAFDREAEFRSLTMVAAHLRELTGQGRLRRRDDDRWEAIDA